MVHQNRWSQHCLIWRDLPVFFSADDESAQTNDHGACDVDHDEELAMLLIVFSQTVLQTTRPGKLTGRCQRTDCVPLCPGRHTNTKVIWQNEESLFVCIRQMAT